MYRILDDNEQVRERRDQLRHPEYKKPELLANMGITKTHSRPYVSDDNPYSEIHFKTLKTRPEFPKQFGSIEDARAFCRGFFRWYNHEHRHAGIAKLTPVMLHCGHGQAVLDARMHVRLAAYAANPRRFVNGPPVRLMVPKAAWINPLPRLKPDPVGG